MATISYQVRSGYPASVGGVLYVTDYRSYNVGTGLTAGSGTITIDATDTALVYALDHYPPLIRSGTSGDPPVVVSRNGPLIVSQEFPATAGLVPVLQPDGTWVAAAAGALGVGVDNFDTPSGGVFGSTYTLALAGRTTVTLGGKLTANLVITVTGLVAGCEFDTLLTQDATGSRTVTLSYSGGLTQALPVTPTATSTSFFKCFSTDGTNLNVVSSDSLSIRHIQGDPAGAYLTGLVVDDSRTQPYIDGIPLQVVSSGGGGSTGGGFLPYTTAFSADFDAVTAMVGRFVTVTPAAGGITMTLPGARAPLSPGTIRVGNSGPGPLLVVSDNDTLLHPPGLLSIAPYAVADISIGQNGDEFWVTGATVVPSVQQAPVNDVPPTFTGDNHVGSTLTAASLGAWRFATSSPSYQWMWSDDDVTYGPIGGSNLIPNGDVETDLTNVAVNAGGTISRVTPGVNINGTIQAPEHSVQVATIAVSDGVHFKAASGQPAAVKGQRVTVSAWVWTANGGDVGKPVQIRPSERTSGDVIVADITPVGGSGSNTLATTPKQLSYTYYVQNATTALLSVKVVQTGAAITGFLVDKVQVTLDAAATNTSYLEKLPDLWKYIRLQVSYFSAGASGQTPVIFGGGTFGGLATSDGPDHYFGGSYTGTSGGTVSALSSNKVQVIAAAAGVPTNAGGANLPYFQGTMTVPTQVFAKVGTWTGTPSSHAITVQRSATGTEGNTDSGLANANVITEDPDTNGQMPYTLQAADEGLWLRVKVIARNDQGSSAAVYGAWVQVATTGGSSPPPGGTGTVAAVAQKDETLTAEVGVYQNPGIISWYSTPRINGGTIAMINSGNANAIVPWNWLVMGPTANTAQVRIIIRDWQCWGYFADGLWHRLAYSVGGNWWSNIAIDWNNGGKGTSLGAPVMTGGNSTPERYGIWPGNNQPASGTLWGVHGTGAPAILPGSGTVSRPNLRRILVAYRAGLETPNASAKYVMCAALDKKLVVESTGQVITELWDGAIGRMKAVPTDGTYRVFSSYCMAGTADYSITFPSLVGASASEMY